MVSRCGLMGVSLVTQDGKHLCMCLLAIRMYSLMSVCSNLLPIKIYLKYLLLKFERS